MFKVAKPKVEVKTKPADFRKNVSGMLLEPVLGWLFPPPSQQKKARWQLAQPLPITIREFTKPVRLGHSAVWFPPLV